MSIGELKMQIEQCLSRRDYNKLYDILDGEEVEEYRRRDQELYIIGIVSEIHKMEEARGIEKGILFDRNMKEAIRIFKVIGLLLRRLEFGFPIEYQKEIVSFINENEISIICVWLTIQGTNYLYNKELIFERFKNLF